MAVLPALPLAMAQDSDIFPGLEVLVERGQGEFRRGTVLEISEEVVQVDFLEDGEEESCDRGAVWPANEAGLYVDDLANLVHLSPPVAICNTH